MLSNKSNEIKKNPGVTHKKYSKTFIIVNIYYKTCEYVMYMISQCIELALFFFKFQ